MIELTTDKIELWLEKAALHYAVNEEKRMYRYDMKHNPATAISKQPRTNAAIVIASAPNWWRYIDEDFFLYLHDMASNNKLVRYEDAERFGETAWKFLITQTLIHSQEGGTSIADFLNEVYSSARTLWDSPQLAYLFTWELHKRVFFQVLPNDITVE